MSSLILVPSMGRPQSAERLYDEFLSSNRQVHDEMFFVVPDSDPSTYPIGVTIRVRPTGCMSHDVNAGLDSVVGSGSFDYIAFMGDDHSLANTPDWSMIVDGAGFGIIYGPDGSNNIERELPTFWFVSTPIVEALGWISPPYMRHFYLDDAWREIGKASGTLKYVPELYIEHLHFSFGKSEKDSTYEHTMRVGGLDSMMYNRYLVSTDFDDDVAKVKAVMP